MTFFNHLNKPIRANVKDIYKQRDLILFLMKSADGAFFFKSVIGKSWYFIDSIFNILIYYFLICIIYRSNTGADWFAVLLIGISHYFLFQCCLNNTIQVFCTKEHILKQIRINPLVLFSVSFLATIKKSAIFILLVLIIVFSCNVSLYQNLVFALSIYIINLLLLIFLSFSCALMLSVLQVYFRDLSKIVPITLRIMMYLTPVLYSMSFIKNENLRMLIRINPLTNIFDAFHWALLGNMTYSHTSFYWPFFFSVFMFYFSFLFFEKNKRNIIKSL